MFDFTYKNVATIADAANLMADGKAQVIAGNTDLFTYMKGMISSNSPTTLININHVTPSLNYIRTEGGALKIGALTTLTTIANSSTVKNGWAVLAEAALAVGSPELRNMGTIGGNICQRPRCIYYRSEFNDFPCLRKVFSGGTCYALLGINRYHSIFGQIGACFAVCPSDIAPALVALDATIVTNKRSWTAAAFFVPPISATNARREQINALDADEIVTEISIPALPSGTRSTYLKFAFRKAIDFPLVSAAVV
ncbi:MAG: FAD binding domain-containing protein, partial [Dehalococcoidia bacterium]|nr:FAD binding domain-containing protein [Dehalococcoidia bacterium]